MEKSFYKRYINGEERQVWLELIEISKNTDCNEFDKDIFAVLDTTMQRVKHNIEIIVDRLGNFGYVFKENVEPDNKKHPIIYQSANESNKDIIKKMTKELAKWGNIPLSFRSFYENISCINLIGYFPQWYNQEREETLFLLDPLWIYEINSSYKYCLWFSENNVEMKQDDENGLYYYPFSSDEYFKEGISGAGFYGIYLNSKTLIDGNIYGFGIDITFMDYLRLCFRWAGFPALQWLQDEIHFDDPVLQFIKKISKDLLPI
jgi:hypothetical protein